jgi:tetratricopeptide (TPR) repeat protein
MLLDNLGLFLELYRRPRRAFSGILDQGSIVFGAALVVIVSAIMVAGTTAQSLMAAARLMSQQPARPTAGGRLPFPLGTMGGIPRPSPLPTAATAPPSVVRSPAAPDADADEDDAATPLVQTSRHPTSPYGLVAFASLTSNLGSVFGLALLYAPLALLALTVFEPIGSFGVAFRRDFGPLLACTFFAWAAARLPLALVSLAVPFLGLGLRGLAVQIALWAVGSLAFAGLMVVALQTIFGARLGSALAVVALAPVALLLQPFLAFLASPFVLFFLWRYLRGDLGDITWSFSARQSFKRHLQASTLNPRDASAHYELGLIHQRRRQTAEARERFSRAVEIDPGEVDAHYQLGRIAREEKRYVEAIRHFEEVVSRDDAHARSEVWREIGATYLESGSLEHARWALSRYVERRPHDPEGLLRYGEALEALGDAAGAAAQFRACVEAVDTMPAYRRGEVARWKRAARQKLAG